MSKTAAVVVIGGGINGCTTAYGLAKRGVKGVVLVEKGHIASGPTGRSSGIVRQHYSHETLAAMARDSVRVWQNFEHEIGGDAGFVQCGVVFAVGPKDVDSIRATVLMHQRIGIDTHILSVSDMKALDPHLFADDLACGAFEPGGGYADPALAAASYADAAQRLGVEVMRKTTVTGLRIDGAKIAGVMTSAGDISAPIVINVAGVWGGHIAAMAGANIPIKASRHPVVIVRRPMSWRNPTPVWADLLTGWSLKPERNTAVVVGSLADTSDDVDPDNHATTPTFAEIEVLSRRAHAVPDPGRGRGAGRLGGPLRRHARLAAGDRSHPARRRVLLRGRDERARLQDCPGHRAVGRRARARRQVQIVRSQSVPLLPIRRASVQPRCLWLRHRRMTRTPGENDAGSSFGSVTQDYSRRHFHQASSSLVVILSAFSLVGYVLRMNISVASPYMMAELHLDKIQMGQVFSAFMLGYALFQVPWGVFGDRIGPGRTLTAAGIIWGVTTLFTGLTPGVLVPAGVASLVALMGVRFLLGVGEAAAYPLASRAIASWMPASRRAFSFSPLIVGMAIGSAFTPPLVSWVMVHAGWRVSFYLGALIAFALTAWWITSAGSLLDRAGNAQDAPGKPHASWLVVLKDRNVAVMSLSYFFDSYVLFAFVFWLYIYLSEQRGFTIMQSGFYTALPFAVAIPLVPAAGYLCDLLTARYGGWGRRVVGMAGLGLSAIFLFIGIDVASPAQALVGLSLAVGFLLCTEPAYWSTSMDLGGAYAGTAGGVMNMAGNLGGVVSTALVPVLVSHFGWPFAFISAAGCALLGAALWLFVDVRRV